MCQFIVYTLYPKGKGAAKNNSGIIIPKSQQSFTAGEYTLSGVLRTSVQEEQGKRSEFINIYAPLNIGEIIENNNIKTESLGGKLILAPQRQSHFLLS